MKRTVSTLIGILLATAIVCAVPPAPASFDELVKRSDFIAVVTITNVTDHVSSKVAWQREVKQSSVGIVKKTIKGATLSHVRLHYQGPPLSISCRPPSLAAGEFLIFLRRDGSEFVRTDPWYSQVVVATNQVVWRWDQTGRIPLEAAVERIQKVLNSK